MRLRTQVTVLGVGTAALVIVLAAVPIALLLQRQASTQAEQRATYAAMGAADYMTTSTYTGPVLVSYLERLNGRGDPPVTVLGGSGWEAGAPLSDADRQAVMSVPAPELGDHDADDHLGTVSAPKTVRGADGRVVQVFCRSGEARARVVAAVDEEAVAGTVRLQNLAVAAIAALLLGLAWLAADLVGRRIARPLALTADTANALSSGDHAARAPVSGPPEVARVATELNALASRIDELLTMERENAADLSHRLRTPLTAVRLGVEALPAGAQRDDLEDHVGDLERSLTRVIRAARRGEREGLHPVCDAAAVVRDRVAFWRPLAEDQQRSCEVEVPDVPTPVRLAPDDLGDAVDALLENAIAHTADGVAIAVRVCAHDDARWIDVLDRGEGIPEAAVERGRSDRGSSGLGLDIARSAAKAAGGRLELVEEEGWRGVRLVLGAS